MEFLLGAVTFAAGALIGAALVQTTIMKKDEEPKRDF